MEAKSGCRIAAHVMSQLFGISGTGHDGNVVVYTTNSSRRDRNEVELGRADRATQKPDGSYSDDGDEAEAGSSDRSPTTVDVMEQWMFFRVPDSFRSTTIMEYLLENIQFAFGEPITLGFYPYVVHRHSAVPQHPITGNGALAVDSGVATQNDGNELRLDDWSKRYFHAIGRIVADDTSTGRKHSNPQMCKTALDLLTEESEKSHHAVSSVPKRFATCSHVVAPDTTFPCQNCSHMLDESANLLEEQNNIMATLMKEVTRTGRAAPILSRTSCTILHELIDAKLNGMEQ